MDRKEVMEFFNKRPRNCLISTANSKGDVNMAVYGSPRMIDENTVVMAVRGNRTYEYLRENPRASIMVVEPGEITRSSMGVRIYLEVISIETEGELLKEFKDSFAKKRGKEAAVGLQAAIRFEITEVRPLVYPR